MQRPVTLYLLGFVIPMLMIMGVFAAFWAGWEYYDRVMDHRVSAIELVPAAFLLLALWHAGGALRLAPDYGDRRLSYWLIAYIAAVFFFLGEDLNWGQYLLDFDAPDYFLAHNKEQELNLHNMSSWFNQKPRLMVELWVLVAGVLVPLGWDWPRRITRRFVPDILWPERWLVGVAVLALLARLPERAIDQIERLIRFSELQELLFTYFMLLYALMLHEKLRPKTRR